MPRDIKKAIEEYQRRFGDVFYTSDYDQIYKMSKGDKFSLIDNALTAGFMIGYRAAERKKAPVNECKSTEA